MIAAAMLTRKAATRATMSRRPWRNERANATAMIGAAARAGTGGGIGAETRTHDEHDRHEQHRGPAAVASEKLPAALEQEASEDDHDGRSGDRRRVARFQNDGYAGEREQHHDADHGRHEARQFPGLVG